MKAGGTVFITGIYENAKARLETEPGGRWHDGRGNDHRYGQKKEWDSRWEAVDFFKLKEPWLSTGQEERPLQPSC